MKYFGLPILIIGYLLLTIPFQSCDPDDDFEKCDTCFIVYKPNIYIYPLEPLDLKVKLNFPMGGKIVTSIPNYRNGWNISVDSSGLINNEYTYLFYESIQPNIWQRNNGWSVKVDQLESFFRNNMSEYGFRNNEIEDFIDYWIPRLEDHPFYLIYPQTKDIIDQVIQLDISKQPDNILRLFYFVEGHDQLPAELSPPTINSLNRAGYFVTEWGVILN